MTDDRPDSVCVIVLNGEGNDARVLVMRRSRGAFAGSFTYVLGGIEPGERAPEAALRELREETGLAALRLFLSGAFDTFYDPARDAIRKVAVFVARVDSRDIVLDDAHDRFAWLTFAEAGELLEFPSHRRMLADVRRDFVDRRPSAWRELPV